MKAIFFFVGGGGKFKSRMQGQALIGRAHASLAALATLATAEICMKCFLHRCLRFVIGFVDKIALFQLFYYFVQSGMIFLIFLREKTFQIAKKLV